MLYAISWLLILILLAIWSAGVWMLQALASWSITGVGALVGQPHTLENLVLPGWVGLMVPSEWVATFKESIATALPLVQSALTALPAATDWLTPLAWLVWGIGLVLLVAGGVVFHALISVSRKSARR